MNKTRNKKRSQQLRQTITMKLAVLEKQKQDIIDNIAEYVAEASDTNDS